MNVSLEPNLNDMRKITYALYSKDADRQRPSLVLSNQVPPTPKCVQAEVARLVCRLSSWTFTYPLHTPLPHPEWQSSSSDTPHILFPSTHMPSS